MSDGNRKYRVPENVVERVVGMLASSRATDVSFRTDMDQSVSVLKAQDRDRKVSVGITTNIGNRRTERWEVQKVADYMRGGFWFPVLDGVVHDGGRAADRREESRVVSKGMHDTMARYTMKLMMVDLLKEAGRDAESEILDDVSLEDFDLEGARKILRDAVAAAPAAAFARLYSPSRDPEGEEPAPRP